eukprot:m.48314 g.48314  ORF g.48314 m.48314 type:complete len:356 (-) comp14946_c0_seq1:113-1180(-)
MAAPEVKDVTLAADRPRELLAEKHAAYIAQWQGSSQSYEHVMSEYLCMSGLYWCLTAVDTLDQRDRRLQQGPIVDFVHSCFHTAAGGFGAAPQHDPHLLYTLSAVQILVSYDALRAEEREGVVRYVRGLQLADGSFQGDQWGEVDTRFSFCALATLALLNALPAVRVDAAAEYVLSCMNFDGGFGCGPGSETHAGQIYCCVGALALARKLYRVDADLLAFYLCERQLRSGGFNGRPEKLPDVCYSWWVLSALAVLGRLHWIDAPQLREFVLACQDAETGGFADRPGDMVDPFHTLFGITALALLGEPGLKPVHPIFCMPEDIIRRVVRDPVPLPQRPLPLARPLPAQERQRKQDD